RVGVPEPQQRGPDLVAAREGAQPLECLRLGARVGQGELVITDRARDGGGDQRVERRHPEQVEHRRLLAGIRPDVPVGEAVARLGGAGGGGHWGAPGVTNGGGVTTASTARPRTSMPTTVPSATSGGRNASAIPRSSSGEKFPLVTSPAGRPSIVTAQPAR